MARVANWLILTLGLLSALMLFKASASSDFTDKITGNTFFVPDEGQCTVTWTPTSDGLSDCQESDIEYTYTRCNPATSKRSLTHFFSKPCKQTAAVPLPPDVHDLSCVVSCDAGEYLRPGAATCEQCPAGTFSIGGGSRWHGFTELPAEFTTSCDASRGECNGWVAQDGLLNSGDLSGINGVASILTLNVEIVKPGNLKYEYRVDAEMGYDGLMVLMDGNLVMYRQSFQFEYKMVTVPISVGVHRIEFMYVKDIVYSGGEDKAWIRSIEIVGTEHNDASCTSCPPGYFSSAGANQCTPCPSNTASAQEGAAECSPCSDSEYSLPAATACIARPACTNHDWYETYGSCGGQTRLMTHLWSEPHICQGGEPLPPAEMVACAPCESGSYRGTSGECIACPEGEASPGAGLACYTCPAGTAAAPELVYDHAFKKASSSNAEDGIWPSCDSGFCSSGGWRMLGNRMDSGLSNSPMSDSAAMTIVDTPNGGSVEFNYSVTSSNVYNRLKFFIDGRPKMFRPVAEEASIFSFYSRLSPGRHELKWVFHKETYASMEGGTNEQSAADLATVFWVRVAGVKEGNAGQCVTCADGFFSKEKSSTCSPCSAGFLANPDHTECKACPPGTFQPVPGGNECKVCGTSQDSLPGSPYCVGGNPLFSNLQCGFVDSNNLVFDLKPLALAVDGGVYPGLHDNRSMTYYISLCGDVSNSSVSSQCYDGKGDRIHAPVCQVTTRNYAHAIGRTKAFHETHPAGTGFTLSYSDGDKSSSCASPRFTNISFTCDLDAGIGQPQIDQGGVEQTRCQYSFQWRTRYACPVCTGQHMVREVGECGPDGTRSVKFFWQEPKLCVGGRLPSSEIEECEVVVVEKNTAFIATAIVAGLLLVFAVSFGALYIRHRRMYQAYSMLKEQNDADLELEAYVDEEDF